MKRSAAIFGTILLTASPALAHHSFAPHFDANRPVHIAGVVAQFEARNPHAYLHLDAVDENGRMQRYVCESHGVTQLRRNGVTAELLSSGTSVVVTGSLSRHDPYMCFFNTVELEDGRVLDVNGPRGETARAAAASPERQDLYGRWLLVWADRVTSGPNAMMQHLTPAGRDAVAAYDPFVDDPTFRCDPVGIRRVWHAPGTPLEIVREPDHILLRFEWMDVERVVHLDAAEHPPDLPPVTLGHSIGRFEGDTLVVETRNYAPGVLHQYVEQPGEPTRGLLHSASLSSVERIRFDPETGELTVSIDLDDPQYFTRPFDTVAARYAPTDLALEPYNCSPGDHYGPSRR